ncbi:hypothetical protein PoB_004550400 [Plakobranchus ocellatus]|uniref:Uncharacterized protein n=1 Tax=Plakobranchus ocellatus TaxID=259542 RepID=A0AAV4BJA2_9GAST|nr:hypothetical protein PoB_004550400 [Plakobranchus ocellatus]
MKRPPKFDDLGVYHNTQRLSPELAAVDSAKAGKPDETTLETANVSNFPLHANGPEALSFSDGIRCFDLRRACCHCKMARTRDKKDPAY